MIQVSQGVLPADVILVVLDWYIHDDVVEDGLNAVKFVLVPSRRVFGTVLLHVHVVTEFFEARAHLRLLLQHELLNHVDPVVTVELFEVVQFRRLIQQLQQ